MGQTDFLYALVTEAELNTLVSGMPAGVGRPWPFRGVGLRHTPGSIGVLWKEPHPGQPIRPAVLVVDAAEQQRLFARFAQVRSDLSPLSSWCHILSPNLFVTLDDIARKPDLGGLEASWAGLIIAEAAILSDRATSQLKLAACLATQTYAIARTLAIWPTVSSSEVVHQFGLLQRDIRSNGPSDLERINLAPLWTALASLSIGGSKSSPSGRVAGALSAILHAREHGADEAYALARELAHLPEAAFLSDLAAVSPEGRLKAFDDLVKRIVDDRSNSVERLELTFLAGYLTTVAAGGSASLGLASSLTRTVPEILGWAYIIGGLGERITWSGGFSGLGRMVARELMRTFRLDDPPTADFAADEARVLVDKQLSDPLVHLQLKQSRIATAALLPGVNLQVPFAEQPAELRRQQDTRRSNQSRVMQPSMAEDALQTIARALVPMIIEQVRAELQSPPRERSPKSKWAKGSQRKLPLTND